MVGIYCSNRHRNAQFHLKADFESDFEFCTFQRFGLCFLSLLLSLKLRNWKTYTLPRAIARVDCRCMFVSLCLCLCLWPLSLFVSLSVIVSLYLFLKKNFFLSSSVHFNVRMTIEEVIFGLLFLLHLDYDELAPPPSPHFPHISFSS